jgi:pseudo-rSAM protein
MMKTPETYWLFLEPYVHAIVRGSQGLLYNSVSRKYQVISVSDRLGYILESLCKPEQNYIIALPRNITVLPEVKSFIGVLRRHFMGDCIKANRTDIKPFNPFPHPVIKKKSEPVLKDFIREISFYADMPGMPDHQIYNQAYRQFFFPRIAAGRPEMPGSGLIGSVLEQMRPLKSANVNFVGISPDNPSVFEILSSATKELPFRFTFYLSPGAPVPTIPGWMARRISLVFLVIQPSDMPSADHPEIWSKIAGFKTVEFHFVVRNMEEVSAFSETAVLNGITKFAFKPFFDGQNLDFFKEQVFIGEEDVRMSRPGQNHVFSRLIMNDNDFGKFHVMPDGTVFANTNDPTVGVIPQNTLLDLVDYEMKKGISWIRSRTKVQPCNDCIYQFLCPPVSNYELLINRFNFCHIFP